LEENETRVNGLALFESGVIPAWEDEVNKKGGEV